MTLGYIVYVIRSGLGRRIQLDRVRLRGLFGSGPSRLSAVNACLYWIFFVTMLALLVSGGLLYFGLYSGYDVAMLHWVGTWVILAFAVLHVVTQYKSGGASQLLRIFRPAPLPAPPQQLDAVELLNLLVEQQAAHPIQPGDDFGADRATEADLARENAPARQNRKTRRCRPMRSSWPPPRRSPALLSSWRPIACRWISLQIHRINSADAPTLDGDTSDRAWRVGQTVRTDHRRRRQFRRQGRDQDRNPRRA